MRTHRAFSLIELVIVISIITLLAGLIMSGLSMYRKSEALNKDAEKIVGILNDAKSRTLASHNSSQYGVHFASTTITLFTGTTYTSSSATNLVYPLTASDIISNVSLTGGGLDIVFIRLTGETSQNGTITLSSPTTAKTRTVTIFKTGLIQLN